MRSRAALTLLELVVVLAVLAAVSGLLVPLFTGTLQNAGQVVTQQSLVEVRGALHDYWRDTRHVTLDGVTTIATEADRFQLQWLFANPVTGDATCDFSSTTRIGWRGPYAIRPAGESAAPGSYGLVDAWNNALEIQDVDPSASPRDVRIVSAGPDGILDIPASTATDALSPADVGDDLYVALALR